MVSSFNILNGALTLHFFFPDILRSQMHADDFRNDNYGVVSELRDGGYSDDMTLAAISGNSSTTLQILLTCPLLLKLKTPVEVTY